MAERFARGGRLIAVGLSPAARSDVRHVAVEFVHPVIVGKRALPALGLTGESGALTRELALVAEPDDIVIAFGEPSDGPELGGRGRRRPRARRALTVAFAPLGAEWELEPPSDDPFVRQELVETTYHVLWELVHVFFEHRGLLEGRTERRSHDAGASSFLYPFLAEREHDLDAVLADVRASALMKAEEVHAAPRRDAARRRAGARRRRRRALRAALEAGGRLLALGNGGSATDAMDVVADFVSPPAAFGWPSRRALDLTADTAIITAIANDIGTEAIFARQVIAYGRAGRRAARAVDERQLAERARRARRGAPARAGDDRAGRLRRRPGRRRAARRPHRDHALAAHPADPGGAGDRLPRAARAGRAPDERRGDPGDAGVRTRARVEGTVQGVGFRPFVYRLAGEEGLAGYVLNDERGVLLEVEGAPAAVRGSCAG